MNKINNFDKNWVKINLQIKACQIFNCNTSKYLFFSKIFLLIILLNRSINQKYFSVHFLFHFILKVYSNKIQRYEKKTFISSTRLSFFSPLLHFYNFYPPQIISSNLRF